MKTPIHFPVLLFAAVLSFSLLVPGACAADKTWNGGSLTDDNWNTGGNWGGTTPVNNDNLIFNGTTRQNNTNNLSNLSVNIVTFGNGGFVLNGNSFTVNGVAPAFFTNAAGTNIIAGPLTTGPTPGNKYWWIAPGSELRLMGVVTNTANPPGASVGWLNLTNGGTVRIMNIARSTRGMDLFQGMVIVDGSSALVDAANDGFRFKPPTGSTVHVIITNNGTIRIGGGGNFRLGHNGTGIGGIAGSGSLSQTTISSGMLELYGANVNVYVGDLVSGATGVFNHNGGLVWGSAGAGNAVTIGNSAGADGTYNLNGGVLWIAQVRIGNAGAATATFNFNGGTLKPTGNSTTFMEGLLNANVLAGGAFIDTTNFNVTIGQALAGSGSLTKLGTGTLTLTGGNTYNGATVVSNGTLVTTSSSFLGGGAITVASNANLSVAFNGTSLSASTLNVGSSVTNTMTLDLGATPTPGSNPVLAVNTLNGTGTALINIAGSGFASGSYPLINFTTGTGLSSIKLGTLPLGLSATLVQSANALSLNVALVPKNLQWSGAIDGNWNTSTFNWADLNNGNNPTNYSQSGGSGDAVTFDDNIGAGATTINIASTVTPSQLVVNNNVSYGFTGAGKISGGTGLAKSGSGFGTLTIITANDYSGGTTLEAGKIFVGHDLALGQGAVTLTFGSLASDSATSRMLTNTIIQNANTGVILGDLANTGPLTLAGRYDLGNGAARVLELASDVVITGSLTNGGVATKTGPGSLTIKGTSRQNVLVTQQQGDVIVDGAQFTSGDGWRIQNMIASSTLRVVVTNGGVFHVGANFASANLRVGQPGGDNSADNILDISGTVNLTPPAAVGANSAVLLGLSGANAILNLRAGGLVIARAVTGGAPANTEVHFSGGTLRPLADEATFLAGFTNAFMENGGVTIDTTNFNVTVPQPLVAAGAGGLTKEGAGTLTLTGANTYSGATAVNAGKLVLGLAHAATGGLTVASNATVAFLSESPGVTVRVPSVTGANGAELEAQFGGLTNNPTAPAGYVTNLFLNGSVGVNLVAANIKIGQFPLIGYNAISGSGSLTIGQLPQGVVGSLVTNTGAKTIDLVVSSVTPIVWRGSLSGNWDTTTTNWALGVTPAAYAQGDNVRFDDSASNSTVAMTLTITPGGVTVSNRALSYQLGGGSLGGSMSLIKDGTNSLALNSANSFLGAVTINAGTLFTGNATALGATNGATTVLSGGALDVNGSNLGLEPVVLTGTGVNGLGALNNSGADQNNALRDVTLTGDTVIRTDFLIGIRMPDDTDPGFRGNGYRVTKVGAGGLNLNGGQTNPGSTIWDSDIGDLDILEGNVSFQRRMMLGRATNSIHVASNATLALFALNTSMPVPTKPVFLTNGLLRCNGNDATEGSTFGGPISLVGGSNVLGALTGTTLQLQGTISGAGSLHCNSSAAGTVALAGAATHTGVTTVQIGTLRLDASASLAATPSIRVDAGATFDVSAFTPWTLGANQTLAGSGTVNGSVLANGTVAPGTSIGELTFNSDLTLAGTNVMELTKDGGLTNDVITVAGTLTYGGRLNVVVTGSTPLAVDDTFKLFNFTTVPTGSFTLSLPTDYTWDTSQLAVDGTIKVTAATARPHPAFTSVTTSGNSVILSGTNATGSYILYSSTNVALPLSGWTPVFTNSFGGPFSFTNVMDAPQQFYRLQ